MLTEIYLCHACSYHEIEDGHARTGLRAVRVAAGQAVVREGEAGDAFYVVLRGAPRRRGLLYYWPSCNIIEAPWSVNGGHGASLRHHKQLNTAAAED